MTSPSSTGHPGILPSLAVQFVKLPLNSKIGPISRRDLLAWSYAEPPSPKLKRELVELFVGGRRNVFAEIWEATTNIEIRDNWREALTSHERARLLPLILKHRDTFEYLTLRQIKDESKMPVVEVLSALARLEALNWVAGPFSSEDLRPVQSPVPVDDKFKGEVNDCLNADWVKALKDDDLRFPRVGKSTFKEWLSTELNKLVLSGQAYTVARDLLKAHNASWVEELLDIAEHLVREAKDGRRSTLEAQQRWVTIFCKRYGGVSGLELDRVGKLMGITRERVRQICDAQLAILADRSVQMPALDRVFDVVTRVTPIPLHDANLQVAQYLGCDGGLEAALEFAIAAKKATQIRIEESKFMTSTGYRPLTMVYSANDSAAWTNVALSLARKDCVSVGCTSFARIAGLLTYQGHIGYDYQSVKSVFEHTPGFRLLDEDSGWFTLSDSEASAAANRMRKLMSVSKGTTDLDTVAAALMTDDRWFIRSNFHALTVPPLHVLSSLFAGWDWLRANKHNIYTSKAPIDPASVLSNTELAAFKLLTAKGGAATRDEMNRTLVAETCISTQTVSFLLSSSPIIQRLESGVYGIRGWDVPAEAILAIRKAKLDDRYPNVSAIEGEIQLTQTSSSVANGRKVLYLPGYLSGRYVGTFSHAGGKYRGIRVNAQNQIYHLSESAEALGIQPGERFTLKLDPDSKTFEISRLNA